MNARRTQGFTLPEILVSLSLITVVASATLGLLPGLARTNAATRDEQRVTLVAKSFYETLTSVYDQPGTYDQLPPAPVLSDGVTCPAAGVTVLASAAGQPALKRVALRCSLLGKSYAFERDFARP